MTELEYLKNTYLFESKAKIVDYWKNEFWEYIILDKTIFYPQWWGQPTDVWEISISEPSINFKVKNVRLDEKWIVFHYWEFSSEYKWDDIKNTDVILNVDSENRIINSKNHTAWHLVDIAMKNIWINIIPTKWFHFKSGSYVEYSWSIQWLNEWNRKEKIINNLKKELENLISQNLKVIVENWKIDISNSESPKWKNFRFVYFEWYKELWCGCWWTHLKNTWEVWKVSIRKIREKKWVVKVSYEVV